MNDLLKKQIEKHFGGINNVPEDILPFVREISRTYDKFKLEKTPPPQSYFHAQISTTVEPTRTVQETVPKSIVSKLKSSLSSALTNRPVKSSSTPKDENDIAALVTRLEKQLSIIKKHEEKLTLIKYFMDQSTDSIEVTDIAGRLLYINQRGADLLEDSVENLLGKYIYDIDNKMRGESSWHRIIDSFKDNKQLTFNRLQKFKNGNSLLMEIVLNKIEINETPYIMGVSRYISDRKKAEKEREHFVEKLREMNKELEDFAYIISHDLKAPLRGISTLASWLSEDYKDSLDKEGKELLQLLNRRVSRMYSLIDGVLMYSRIGRTKKRNKQLDTNIILAEVIESLEIPTGFEVIVNSNLPVIFNDDTQIRQVFQNFISNAIKYNDKGQNGKVIVRSKDLSSHWQFCIADNGPGIPAKYHDKIFQIFQTLQRRDDFESTGVGLTIVSKIIKNNGGKIWVESTEGQGTEFYFTIKK